MEKNVTSSGTEPADLTRPASRGAACQGTHASNGLSWRQHLQELPVYTPGVRLTPADRARYATAVAGAHRAGGSKRGIAFFLGCSQALVQRLLDLAEGLDETSEAHRVEKALRNSIADGTYRVGDVLPSRKQLCVQFRVRDDSVQRALARLTQAGLTLGVSALGSVVTDPQAPPTGPTLRVRTRSGRIQTWTLPGSQSPRIRDVITSRIKDGIYPEGSKFPGAKALTEEFGITEGTLKSALRPLRARGILTGIRQGGTIVHSSARTLLGDAAEQEGA
ncbi:GntR family transcriptional regulator [Streptomyces sp. NPDC001709]